MTRIATLLIAVSLPLTAACDQADLATDAPPIEGPAPAVHAGAILPPATTIQGAIDLASNGDVIAIPAGSYLEDLTISKDVTLKGAGQGDTVIFGEVIVTDFTDATLQDLTLDGGLSGLLSVGIDADDAALTLTRVTVQEFHNGVLIEDIDSFDESPHTIDGCTFTNNGDSGLELQGVRSATITNSIASFNGNDGFWVHADAEHDPVSIDFVNCLAFANGFDFLGGAGFTVHEDDNVLIVNSISVSNSVGLECSSGCVNLDNIIWGNFTNYDGATAGAGNLNLDPRFNGPSEGDFTLRFDSPAIDAGDAGVAPTTDIAGKGRPIGDGADIGPHEFGIESADVDVVLNEIMSNPLDEGAGEFIELFNTGTSAVDVAGWVIDDGDATDAITGWNGGATTIPAGGYGVILDPDYPGAIYTLPGDAVLLTVASTSTLGSGLSNNDPVKLYTADGTTPVDSYTFPFNAGNGISVEKDNVADGDVGGNWVASPCGSSPGAENCAAQPVNVGGQITIAINEIMANPLVETTGEFIELYNWGDAAVDVAGMLINDGDATDEIAAWQGGGTSLAAGQYAVILDPDYTSGYTLPPSALLLTIASTTTLGNGLANNDPISLTTANGLSVIDSYTSPFNAGNGTSVEKVDALLIDTPSNFVTSTCASGSSPGAPNCITQDGVGPTVTADIFITEVMANADNEDTGEFVELFNFGDEPVDLAGFRISDGDKEEVLQAFTAGGSTVIPALGYAVVLDAEYANDYTIPAGTTLLRTPDTTIGSGLATNDPIKLRAKTGAAVIATYAFPFNPGNAVSAERIDLFIGDVQQNWVGSPCGASPGADNCASDSGPPPSTAPISTTSIVISEVMANPIIETEAEFVELFNAGPIGVDVAGWIISDGDASDTLEAFSTGGTVIGPGEIAVILDPDYANNYVIGAGTVRLKTGNTTIGNGLTTTDPITLFEADGATVVDTFSFPTNPGNGRSLEKVTLTAGDVAANWVSAPCAAKTDSGAANGPYFASPGRRNCADPFGGISGTNSLGQECPFGAADCLSGLCALDLQNFGTFCTEDCTSLACSAGFDCVAISDVNYANICVPTGGGAVPEVVINELLYDADGGDSETFIELKGAPGTILDGLTLVGINGADAKAYTTLSLTGQIPSDGYFVIAHPSATGDIAANADMTSSKVDFQNGPDSVQLRQGSTVLDAVGYGSFSSAFFGGEGGAAPDVTPGSSLTRLPDGDDVDDNSLDFYEDSTPTPGTANSL